jgi:hypothetical protein
MKVNSKSKYYKILGKLKGFSMPNNFPRKIVLVQRKSQIKKRIWVRARKPVWVKVREVYPSPNLNTIHDKTLRV